MVAVHGGRLSKTFRRWFQTQFPDKLDFLPGAPLRAMNFQTAGGSFSGKKPNGEARNPVAQFNYDMHTKNVFDNAVVIVDEFHNLVERFGAAKMKLLPRQLITATNLTLVGALHAFGASDRVSHMPLPSRIPYIYIYIYVNLYLYLC